MRAHSISLTLVLELTVSLVWGQAPTGFTQNSAPVTGPLPLIRVGIGTIESPSLACITTNAVNSVWLFPNGTEVTWSQYDVVARDTDTFVYVRVPASNLVFLRRGGSVHLPVRSPGGKYCCGSATNVNERLCINLVVDCETPPSIFNGSPGTLTSTLLGGTVTYTCNSGYQISPGVTMATASCLATGNWETVTCLAITCGPLPTVDNGTIMYSTDEVELFDIRTVATHHCNEGFELSASGESIRHCVSNGTSPTGYWNGTTPTCQAICLDLQSLMNGVITYQPAGTVKLEGTTATHSCTSGYRLSGGPVRVCQSDRTWSGDTITCPVVDCGTLPSTSNGYPETPTSTLLGGTVTFICNRGYHISPGVIMTTMSCLATGNWSTPNCSALCPDLRPLRNGAIAYQLASTTQLAGTTATHSCTSGYVLSGGPVRVCQSDGTWSGETITCPVMCRALQAIANGGAISYGSAGRLEGGTAVYSCVDGFQLSSDISRTCEYRGMWIGGVWNGIEPSCLAICPDLADITNGVISYSVSSRVENSMATYSCTMNLDLLGEPTRTCQNNRTWSGEEPYCQRIYVSLGSMTFTSNNSKTAIKDIREEGSNGGLTCVTDLSNCCDSFQGWWLFPNATKVPERDSGADIYIDRGDNLIQLNKRNAATSPTGKYCCVLPTRGGMEKFCLNVTGAVGSHPLSQSDTTTAVLSAVVVILGLALILIAVIIAYLVLKLRRFGGVDLKKSDIPLSNRGQCSPVQMYGTKDVTYEEVGLLQGSYEYTECQGYETTPRVGVVSLALPQLPQYYNVNDL